MSTAPAPTRSGGVTLRAPRVLLTVHGLIAESAGAADVRGLVRRGDLLRPPEHTVVVYEMTAGEHRQTGVLAEVAVADYRAGHVRPHEATDPERVRRLTEHTRHTGMEQTPVLLGHAPRPALREVLAAARSATPVVDLATETGEHHRAWFLDDPELCRTVHTELAGLSTLYIADGHHRLAAADRFVTGQPELTGDHPGLYRLGALFPQDEMRSFAYPRSVPQSMTPGGAGLLAALRNAPGTADLTECGPAEAPTQPGVAGVFAEGRWYRLTLRPVTGGAARGTLDTVRLDEQVIHPALGPGSASPVSGVVGAVALGEWCTQHSAVGFLPHPPSVSEVTAVADAGEVLPAKSTWFDPKAPRGVFLRELVQPDLYPE
ncbi:DUF1015 family protein [Lipingzhangella sp. LS1_29]|uniref:DUF1015 family protein n=1 Tax=Lipingzhangella rawalii TaxID=2055835 RepID=A0ABU2H8E9_9ACTN|nr:DUF1015 family protein [Lipingzhangella rawalii]MDS1271585.1 DUF1015 family protein [Lipingzhangella rawalii]